MIYSTAWQLHLPTATDTLENVQRMSSHRKQHAAERHANISFVGSAHTSFQRLDSI